MALTTLKNIIKKKKEKDEGGFANARVYVENHKTKIRT